MKINSLLLPMKAHYFFVFAATAPMLPFLPLFGRQLGLQSGITLIYTVLPFAGVLAKVLAGGVADAKGLHKTILLSSMAVTALGLFSLYFTPSIPLPTNSTVAAKVSLDCTPASTYFRYEHSRPPCGRRDYLATITESTNVSCSAHCSNDAKDNLPELCSDWKASPESCSSSFSFSATVELLHSDREGDVSFIYIEDVTFNGTGGEVTNSSETQCVVQQASLNSSSSSSQATGCTTNPSPRCPTMLRLPACSVVCEDMKLMEYLDAPEKPLSLGQIMHYPQFWMFLSLMLVAWSCFAIVVTLSDTVCFMLLGESGGDYGRQRVWGAVGWGLLVVVAGALIDAVSGHSTLKDYTPAFLLTLALFSLDIGAVTRIKLPQAPPASPSKPSMVSCLCWGPAALRLLGQPRVALFVLSCVVVGASTGALWTYQLMLVEEVAAAWQCDFRWFKLLDGLMLAIQCFLGELPFFLLAGVLLARLGHVICMTVVILTFGLRFVLYSVVQNPWLFLPIEVLQGLTFGLFYSTMTSYASAVALPGTEATVQALVGAAFEGLGVAIGGSLGGALFFQYGGKTLFLILGAFDLCFAVLFAFLNWLIAKYQPKSAYQPHCPVSSTEPISELSSADGAPVLS